MLTLHKNLQQKLDTVCNMKNLIIITIYLIIGANQSLAQTGPNVLCNNCEGLKSKTIPLGGSWYNPEQNGSGFLFDFQDDILVGYYFGYDEEGEPTWFIFSGKLQESNDVNYIWFLDTYADVFQGGNAINQDYVSPTVDDSSLNIRLEFSSLKYARFSFDGGEYQNITPIIFGSGGEVAFEETEHFFPDINGLWTFVFKRNYPDVLVQQHNYYSELFYIDKPLTELLDDGTKQLIYSVSKFFPYPPFESPILGSLVCENPFQADSTDRKVICYLTNFPSSILGNQYSGEMMIIPLDDFGAYQFSGEFKNDEFEESGLSFDARKVIRL